VNVKRSCAEKVKMKQTIRATQCNRMLQYSIVILLLSTTERVANYGCELSVFTENHKVMVTIIQWKWEIFI
jgi:hypothetical protein